MPEPAEGCSAARDVAQRALRRIVVDAARASRLSSLTAEQRAEWRERAEVWADTTPLSSPTIWWHCCRRKREDA
jgi:hypothetical protein